MSHVRVRGAWGVVLALACIAAGGCECGRQQQGGKGAVPRGPAPSYAEVAAKYNERVGLLDRLWATAVVVMNYRDRDGTTRHEQGEGHVQVVRPDRLALSVGKVGEVYFWLGGDAERYWWFDRQVDKTMWVGRYDGPAAGKQEHAAPIHPLDLIEFLAITPLPADGGRVAWSEDGARLVATLPARKGTRRIHLDPETFEPDAIELVNEAGEVAVSGRLSEFEGVKVIGSGLTPRVPGFIEIRVPGREAGATVRLNDQECGPKRPKAGVFDLEVLERSLGVSRLVDVDREAEAGEAH